MKLRAQSGIHSAELVAGLMILIPIVLYGLDYAAVMYGGQMNSSACSAAARAAANGPPTGYGTPLTNNPKNRASMTLQRMAQPGAVVRVKQTVRTFERLVAPIPKNPYGGPFKGSVTVKTRCDVFPPFLLPFVPKQATLYTQQSYPITYTLPADYTPGAVSLIGGGAPQDLAQPIPNNAP